MPEFIHYILRGSHTEAPSRYCFVCAKYTIVRASTRSNDYISIPRSSSLNITGGFTFDDWVYSNTTTSSTISNQNWQNIFEYSTGQNIELNFYLGGANNNVSQGTILWAAVWDDTRTFPANVHQYRTTEENV